MFVCFLNGQLNQKFKYCSVLTPTQGFPPSCPLWYTVFHPSGYEEGDTGAREWELLVSHQTTLQLAITPVSKVQSTPLYSPQNLSNMRTHTHTPQNLAFRVDNKHSTKYLDCITLLTVSQEVDQHFHLRQGVDAGEICPVRMTFLRRLLPASRFCFWQHSVAKTIVRPPAIRTLGIDILPVLCKGREDISQTRIFKAADIIFGLAANSATQRKAKGSAPRCSAAAQSRSKGIFTLDAAALYWARARLFPVHIPPLACTLTALYFFKISYLKKQYLQMQLWLWKHLRSMSGHG